MYIVPHKAPAASAAATPRSALPPDAWADDATASSVEPANIAAAPPHTPSRRAAPASRSSLKSRVPHRMPRRLLAFHRGKALASTLSLMASIVRGLATGKVQNTSKDHVAKRVTHRT